MFITEKQFENMDKFLNIDQQTLSKTIRINNNILYKRIYSLWARDELINIYKKRNSSIFNDYVIPKKLLYTYNLKFFGYIMDYYDGYVQFNKIISERDNFEYQIAISKKIINLFKQIRSESLVYYDIHGGNIIVKDTDVKIVDIDSIVSERLTEPFIYKRCQINECCKITELIIRYLLGINDLDDLTKYKNILSKELLSFINACSNYDSSIRYASFADYIDELDEEKVKHIKSLIIKK